MLLFLAQTTQQAIETAVSAKADQWYTPLITALVVAGVALIAGLGGLVMAWVGAGKAKAQAVEARARAEVLAAEARARADAAAAASAVNSDRITTVARKADLMQDTLTKVALHTPPPAAGNVTPAPSGIVGDNIGRPNP